MTISEVWDDIIPVLRDDRDAITYEGNKVIFDPEVMVVDRPYMFVYKGNHVIVMKTETGDLDFYHPSITDTGS